MIPLMLVVVLVIYPEMKQAGSIAFLSEGQLLFSSY